MEKSATLILAATVPAMGIGKSGGLPWSLKREMKYFRQVTEGGIVVMGRRTWESIPPKFRPLRNRTNIVVTSSQEELAETVHRASSLQQAFDLAKGFNGSIFVIGGGQLYAAAAGHPQTKHILLTEISHDVECDTFFQFDKEKWKKQSFQTLKSFVGDKVELENPNAEENGIHYEFTLYNRL